jgi:ribonuclease T2
MLRRCLFWACTFSWLIVAGCRQPATHPAAQSAQARIANADAVNSSVPVAPANFDYYLFTLSWSPEYCHGHPNNPQCDGGHPGFVVHGLWPQFNNGQWPSACSSAPGLSNPDSMLEIMPDPRLIQHEWSTHGTCSGLTADQYFDVLRHAYASIQIPPALVSPTRTIARSTEQIKRMFTDANPRMFADEIAISCHNRYLSAVEFCLSKRLQPIACQAVRDCNAASIRIPASR